MASKRASDVRVQEVDLTTSLSGASTVTAAIVGISSQGPSVPTFYSNPTDFLFDWGNPNPQVSFTHSCVLDYFYGGSGLWASRAVGAGAKYSGALVKLNSSLNTVIVGTTAGVVDPENPDFASLVPVTETPLYMITSKRGQGSYGNNLAVEIVSANVNAPSNLSIDSTTTGGSLVAATYQYMVASIDKNGNETLASVPITSVVASATSTNSITVNWDLEPGSIGYKVYGRVSGTMALLGSVGAQTTSFQDLGTLTPDMTKTPIQSVGDLAAPSSFFTLNVYDLNVSRTNAVESFNCSVIQQVDSNGMQMEITQQVNPFSRYIKVYSNIPALMTTPQVKSAARVSLLGGTSGAAPTTASINAKWAEFTNKDRFQLDVLINGGLTARAVVGQMDMVAQARGDCIAYLDTPAGQQTAQGVVDYRNLTLNLNTSYSALFAQDLLENDPINGMRVYVPPSGAMAALLGRAFATSQPWFSTAGLNRGILPGNVIGLRHKYDDASATLVYQANVSYMRSWVGRGISLHEQNTLLNKNSALQFINVRVLCNVIKRAMYGYLIYALQEQNDDILHKQVSDALNQYLDSVAAGRGISKYQVICNSTNNTPALMNAATLAVAVIIYPIKAVRAVELSLVLAADGMTVSEAEIASLS